jgi:hypothetical protein
VTLAVETSGSLSGPLATSPVVIAVGLVACAAIVASIPPLIAVGFDYEKFYSEGYNAYHATRAAAGEVLYTGDPERLLNYPFLSFYLVGWLKPLFGDILLIGRVLSIFALAATVIGSAVVVRRLGGQTLDGVFAAACVLGYQIVQAPAWIGSNDPQFLAEALMIGGLACYLGDRASTSRLAVTALLFALGGFTKHNLVAIPIAVTLDILFNNRRAFALWSGFALAALAFLTGLAYLVAGGDFFNEVLAPRAWGLTQMKYHLQKFAIAFKLPIVLTLVYLARPLTRDKAVLLRSYGVVSLATAIIFAGGEGTSFNTFLDVVVFLGIVAGLALQRWRLAFPATDRLRRYSVLLLLLPLIIAQPIVQRIPATTARLLALHESLKAYAEEEEKFGIAKAALRSHPGAALCESLLMCLEAGKPLLVDTFNTRQMILTGRMREAVLLDEIARHRFAVIQLPSGIYLSGQPGIIAPNFSTPPRLTETTLHTIDKYYRPAAEAGGRAFYVPKP